MTRRTRLLAGVFALVAMALSTAETVLASTCAPVSDRTPAAHAGMERNGAPSHPGDCLSAGQDAGGDHDPTHCPFGAMMGEGCVSAASIPALPSPVDVDAPRALAASPSEVGRPDFLLIHPLFHPPRA